MFFNSFDKYVDRQFDFLSGSIKLSLPLRLYLSWSLIFNLEGFFGALVDLFIKYVYM